MNYSGFQSPRHGINKILEICPAVVRIVMILDQQWSDLETV